MYIKESIKTRRLQELEDPAFEVLLPYIRPPRLPVGINCVVTACVYHPPSSNDTEILEYLSDAITRAEGLFLACGIIIAGDFNQLDTKHLCRDFRLKQLVHQPNRGANILDLALTTCIISMIQNQSYFYQPLAYTTIVLLQFGRKLEHLLVLQA